MTPDDIEAEVRALAREMPGSPPGACFIAAGVGVLAGAAALYWLWPVILGGTALITALIVVGAWATK